MTSKAKKLFLEEIMRGNISKVKTLLKSGIEVNFFYFWDSPLTAAAGRGNIKMIKLLLNNGADINARHETNKNTALSKAIIRKQIKTISFLLKHGASINSDENCNSPLHVAVANSTKIIICMLLKRGANINARNEFGETPLLTYILQTSESEFSIEIIKLLINKGAHIDVRDDNDNTPLKLAAKDENNELMHILACNGADLNDGCLYVAVKKNNMKVVETLLKCGADVNQWKSESYIPLDAAIVNQNIEMATLLLQHNCNINYITYQDNIGITPLHLAAIKSSMAMFNLLIQYGANINALDSVGATVLHYAVRNRNSEILQALVHSEFNAFNGECVLSPICIAAVYRQKDNLIYLMNTGARFNFNTDINALEYIFANRTDYNVGIISDMIERYLIKMKFLNVHIPEEILIYFDSDITDQLEQDCKKEIESMKNDVISSYKSVSLFHFILTDGNSYLQYTGMMQILNENKLSYSNMYQNYYDILEYKINKFTEKVNLLDKSYKILSNIFNPHYNLPHLIISNILKYCTYYDMMNLVYNN